MLRQVEGSKAVADAVALCRPDVICAYPISPQTHIVEALSELAKRGVLGSCQYVNVESEFGAMSASIGASATGARSYTATSSQGLLFMVEAVYNASGLGLPIVMTVANRAIGAPINIWNDHSDSMSQRDSGWIQLYAATNQEAADLHIQAFRIAEEVSVPVMVCMDGFILTHAIERIDTPEQDEVDAFLPAFVPRQVLDPNDPVSIGALVGPEAYSEVRYVMHARHMQALDVIAQTADDFARQFGRVSGGLVRGYRTDDADTVIVALGSILGTIEDVVDELRDSGEKVGALGITCFRPYPHEEVRNALASAARVIVLEKTFAVGAGSVVGQDVRMALQGCDIPVHDVVAGLGGRPIMKASIHAIFEQARAGNLSTTNLTFLDLDRDLVEREFARLDADGYHAQRALRDLEIVSTPVVEEHITHP